MSDTDRRLDDHEKRLARLERAAEKPAVAFTREEYVAEAMALIDRKYGAASRRLAQFCDCGREICRAPDCPSHKPDPMGR